MWSNLLYHVIYPCETNKTSWKYVCVEATPYKVDIKQSLFTWWLQKILWGWCLEELYISSWNIICVHLLAFSNLYWNYSIFKSQLLQLAQSNISIQTVTNLKHSISFLIFNPGPNFSWTKKTYFLFNTHNLHIIYSFST